MYLDPEEYLCYLCDHYFQLERTSGFRNRPASREFILSMKLATLV